MNSGPKYHRHDHDNKCPVRGLTLLRVNSGTLGPTTFDFFTTPQTITGINQPITSVSINAENLRSPIILIRFLGILTATAFAAVNAVYTFSLIRTFKSTDSQETLATFTVAQQIAVVGLPDSRSLDFAFADCFVDCDGCATYTLELSSVNSTVAVSFDVAFTGTMSVLAVEADC